MNQRFGSSGDPFRWQPVRGLVCIFRGDVLRKTKKKMATALPHNNAPVAMTTILEVEPQSPKMSFPFIYYQYAARHVGSFLALMQAPGLI